MLKLRKKLRNKTILSKLLNCKIITESHEVGELDVGKLAGEDDF